MRVCRVKECGISFAWESQSARRWCKRRILLQTYTELSTGCLWTMKYGKFHPRKVSGWICFREACKLPMKPLQKCWWFCFGEYAVSWSPRRNIQRQKSSEVSSFLWSKANIRKIQILRSVNNDSQQSSVLQQFSAVLTLNYALIFALFHGEWGFLFVDFAFYQSRFMISSSRPLRRIPLYWGGATSLLSV